MSFLCRNLSVELKPPECLSECLQGRFKWQTQPDLTINSDRTGFPLIKFDGSSAFSRHAKRHKVGRVQLTISDVK